MRANWLNIFFYFSGKIFNLKQKLISASHWYAGVFYALQLFFVELVLIIISFPLYFLVSPKNIQKGGLYSTPGSTVDSQGYIWRRKISLTAGFSAFAIFLIKIILVGGLSVYFLGAQKLLASTQNWTFTSPSDYVHNPATIEIAGGMAQLKGIGTTITGSTTNSGFNTNLNGWTYADWDQGAGEVNVAGSRISASGNPGGWARIRFPKGGGDQVGGYYRQPFVTTVANPSTTVSFDWQIPSFDNAPAPLSFKLYVFVDTGTGAPVVGQEVWSSGEITTTSGWVSVNNLDVSSKVTTPGTYYLKFAAWIETSALSTGPFDVGFDNIILNWSKTTYSFSTSSPTTTPVNSLTLFRVDSWNGFTETANKNGGEISYQLSSDDGVSWKYWNNVDWVVAGANDFNIASVVNSNISSFSTSTGKIKWRAFMTSDGSQQVQLSGVSITYTQNDPPQITGLAASQDTGNGNVRVSYNLQDSDSDPQSLVNFEYSLTGAFAGEQVAMIASTTDAAHSGTTDLSSSPAGIGHVFAWDARSQLGGIATSSIFVRLRASDGIANSAFMISSAFAVDYVAPIISNASAMQATGTKMVNISYDLSDNSASDLNVILAISNDGGSTWTVPTTSATGNVGHAQNSGIGKTISWNAGADYLGNNESDMRVRLVATDALQNQSNLADSANFSLDTTVSTVGVLADLQAQPNAGASVVLISGSFVETNPNSNDFYVAIDGGDYGSVTVGDSDTATPSAQNTNVATALKGNNYISKVKVVHTDDFGQIINNENTSPNTAFKFVKPFTPATPIVNNPGETQLDVLVNKNSDEADGLEYAILETSQNQYVQADGTLGSTAVWQVLGTDAGQWGNGMGEAGKIVVTGLSAPLTQYSFAIKSRNSADLAHAASSESNLSSAAGFNNTAASILINSISQPSGSSYALINYTGTDAQNDPNNLVAFEYSTDATNWYPMTEKSGVGSDGIGPLNFSSGGARFVFAWDVVANLPDFESSVVRIRLKSNDSLLDSNLAESAAFVVDTKAPVVSNITAVQSAGSGVINFVYDLTDSSAVSNTVQAQISDDNGATWSVPVVSISGDIGDNVSAGVSRLITWSAATDYPNSENANLKIRIKATDRFGNSSSFVESGLFTVDTKAPLVSSVTAMVSSTNKVVVSYNLADITAASNTVEFQVSDDNGATWNVATTTRSGEIGSGQTTGVKTFVWDALSDFDSHSSSQMKVRVRAFDYFGNLGEFAVSDVFALDAGGPVISNLTGVQIVSSTTIRFSYDLADDGPNVSVVAMISSDSGSTWTVATSALAGDIGLSVSPGNGKIITWGAGTDFGGQESHTIRIKLQATDNSGNISAPFESPDFSVDTLGPVALANFRKIVSTATSVTLSWGNGVADANFNHYELWYGSSESEVNSRSGGSSRWSTAQDSSLGNILSAISTITGLNITGDFFVKIFSVDRFGNASTLPAINVYTPPEPEAVAPVTASSGGGMAIPVSAAPGRPLLFSLASPSNKLTASIAGLTTPGASIDVYDNGNFVRRLDSLADSSGRFNEDISVAEGIHSLMIKAVSSENNASDFSEPVELVVDITPPSRPLIFNPAADSVIVEAEPILIGGTEPGVIVSIALDNVNKFTTTADASGAWQFILPSQFALVDGRHSFVLTSVDRAGNESSQTILVLTKVLVPGIAPVAPSATNLFSLPVSSQVVPPTPPAALIQQNIAATEVSSLLVPKINTTTPSASGNEFIFSGTALPNHDVLVFIHSSQALIYRAHSDNNGFWQVAHAQDVAELAPGEHTIFAVSVDSANQVKSRPSAVQSFTIKKNFLVSIFNLLNLPTTIVTLMALGFTLFWLYRLRVKQGIEV